MKRGTPRQALLTVLLVVVVCATLVSAAVVLLRPVQADNRLLRQATVVLGLVDAAAHGSRIDRNDALQQFRALDARVVDLDSGRFDPGLDPYDRLLRADREALQGATEIPAEEDWAGIGYRGRHAVVYLAWSSAEHYRLVLPVHGAGMWSTIRGYVMLEEDLNTIAGAVFHEQAETPGLGDRIASAEWLEKWRGRKIYDEAGEVQFAVASGRVAPGSAAALYEVDALTGATVTADAVTHMMRFWFGPWGFQDFLAHLRENPPAPPGDRRAGT